MKMLNPEWWRDMAAWIFAHPRHLLPAPGLLVWPVSLVRTPFGTGRRPEGDPALPAPIAAWVAETMPNRVMVALPLGERIAFRHAADMVLFRLRWSEEMAAAKQEVVEADRRYHAARKRRVMV